MKWWLWNLANTFIDQGSPDDPNELSFEKGETIDILDKRGNWWQARKADGSTGIVPSNYVSWNYYDTHWSKTHFIWQF